MNVPYKFTINLLIGGPDWRLVCYNNCCLASGMLLLAKHEAPCCKSPEWQTHEAWSAFSYVMENTFKKRFSRCGVKLMLVIAQRTSNYKPNPSAVAQEKCDNNLGFLWWGIRTEKSKITKRTHRIPFCVLQNINLTLALLPRCQILVKLPGVCDYWAYKGKQRKLIEPDSRLVAEKVATLFNLPYSLTGFFPASFFLLLFSSFTPG